VLGPQTVEPVVPDAGGELMGDELWVLTAQEQSRRWLESPLGKRAERARANRANLNGYRALGEGARLSGDRPMGDHTAAVHERLFGAPALAEADA
jgi:hypothetical protein